MNFKSPITWFHLILITYTCYDYVEHISRSGSIFAEHPGPWFLFTLFSILSILAIFHIVNYLFGKLFRKHWMIFELIGLFLAISCHIMYTGPMYDHLFWPYGQLNFFFTFGPIFILLSIYFAFRMLWLLGSKLIRKHPKLKMVQS